LLPFSGLGSANTVEALVSWGEQLSNADGCRVFSRCKAQRCTEPLVQVRTTAVSQFVEPPPPEPSSLRSSPCSGGGEYGKGRRTIEPMLLHVGSAKRAA